jgi:cell shape-determining protein MreC
MDIERIKIYTDLIKKSLEKYSEYTLSVELSKSEMEHLKSLFNIAESGFPGTYIFTKKTLDN